MYKIIFISGSAVITRDQKDRVVSVQFLPDDELAPVLEQGSRTHGQLQQLRNGSFDFIPNRPRVRANSLLICKMAHGRLSGTRDHAWQLTLKCFASEAIDWQKAFVVEPIEAMTNLMGPERMSQILNEMLNKLSVKAL